MVASARLSRAALLHNLNVAKRRAPSSKIMGVVKANAYGHGADEIASILAGHVDAFAVSNMDEADQLRAGGITEPVVLLQGVQTDAELHHAVVHDYVPVLHTTAMIDLVRLASRRPKFSWIKFNTGMCRLGIETHGRGFMLADETGGSTPEPLNYGVMTHFACADDTSGPNQAVTPQQIEAFDRIEWRGCPPAAQSMANSAGILGWPQSHRDWVRPGIMLYGAKVLADQSAEQSGLRPVMTLEAPIISATRRRAGDAIGYGHTYTCGADDIIATVSCGYGDGYPRHILDPDKPPCVYLRGKRYPVIGRVSMDLLAINLGADTGVSIGDVVELWGEHIPVDEVAQRCHSIGYELLTKVTSRVRRSIV